MIERVPEIGASLLTKIPRLETVSRIVLYQRKNYDGSGFPADSVAGNDIPVGARLLRVFLDVNEVESKGVSREEAFQLLKKREGLYDPKVLESVFVSLDVYSPIAESRPESTTPLMVKDLAVGQVLAADVEMTDGLLLVKRGTEISPLLLEKLRNFAAGSGLREPVIVF